MHSKELDSQNSLECIGRASILQKDIIDILIAKIPRELVTATVLFTDICTVPILGER